MISIRNQVDEIGWQHWQGLTQGTRLAMDAQRNELGFPPEKGQIFYRQNFLTLGGIACNIKHFTYAGTPAYPVDNFLSPAHGGWSFGLPRRNLMW